MIRQLKIGGIYYYINEVEWKQESNGNMMFGLTHKESSTIEINTLISPQLQKQTLIHEMLHAVFFEAGIEQDNEEDLVNRIANVLYQVLQDNDFEFLKE